VLTYSTVYAIAWCPFVCLSVCPSHAGVVQYLRQQFRGLCLLRSCSFRDFYWHTASAVLPWQLSLFFTFIFAISDKMWSWSVKLVTNMVNVIWHKAAAPPHTDQIILSWYSSGGANVHPSLIGGSLSPRQFDPRRQRDRFGRVCKANPNTQTHAHRPCYVMASVAIGRV